MMKTKKIKSKICFSLLFIFFILGSVFGSLFEEVVLYLQNGKWTSRSDLLIGPFSTLYGFGVIIYLLILGKNTQRGIFKTFIYSAILGGVVEYITSLIFEIFLDIKFWDYSNRILDIQGRTTIPIMLIWGIGGTLLLKLVYPTITLFVGKIPHKVGYPIYIIALIFFSLNMFFSYTVFLRTVFRNKGYESLTIVGKMYDYYFDDEYMKKKFPILKNKL